jgi:hypothetical protein
VPLLDSDLHGCKKEEIQVAQEIEIIEGEEVIGTKSYNSTSNN